MRPFHTLPALLLPAFAGCATLHPQATEAPPQQLAASAGSWRLSRPLAGFLEPAALTGVYALTVRQIPAQRLNLDGFLSGGPEGINLGTVEGGLFRRRVAPHFQYRPALPERGRTAGCSTLGELLQLLGQPTLPNLDGWKATRWNVVHDWAVFTFTENGGVRLLHVRALASLGAGDGDWHVDGLLVQEGAAAPAPIPYGGAESVSAPLRHADPPPGLPSNIMRR